MIAASEVFVQSDAFDAWTESLRHLGDPRVEISLPPPGEMPEVLRSLAIPEEDIPGIVETVPDPETEAEMWWFLERSAWSLIERIGDIDPPMTFIPLQDPHDPRHRYFYVQVFVAVLPHVQAWFRKRGIPDDIAMASLQDLGRNVRVHHKRHGVGGLGVAFWLMRHFRGTIFQLGRLQFERVRIGESLAAAMTAAGRPTDGSDLALSLHIPDFIGPLTPEACDASMAEAHAFFAEYFPEERYVAGVCHSWLLDPQLKAYLPHGSNIIRFQQRFALGDHEHDVDTSIVQFVFGPTPANLDELPQRSTLERAVVGHLKAGHHWKGRSGWFAW
jgi:hypothetical protein